VAQYIVEVQATSNSSANTEDTFVEVDGATGKGFFLKRIRVSCNTPNSDVDITPRVVSLSTTGAGGTTFTAVPKRPIAPAAVSTAKVKSGTTAYPVGTVTNTYDQVNVNGRAIWEWIPRGNEEYIDSGTTGLLAVVAKVSSASIVLNVTVEFEE
jgi:hypothetical protein